MVLIFNADSRWWAIHCWTNPAFVYSSYDDDAACPYPEIVLGQIQWIFSNLQIFIIHYERTNLLCAICFLSLAIQYKVGNFCSGFDIRAGLRLSWALGTFFWYFPSKNLLRVYFLQLVNLFKILSTLSRVTSSKFLLNWDRIVQFQRLHFWPWKIQLDLWSH